jgi:hypothetical protein
MRSGTRQNNSGVAHENPPNPRRHEAGGEESQGALGQLRGEPRLGGLLQSGVRAHADHHDGCVAKTSGQSYSSEILEVGMMYHQAHIAGMKFGRLTAIRVVHKTQRGNMWLCECECGKETCALPNSLTSGNTSSCGCLNRERILVHGFLASHRKSPLFRKAYMAWSNMKQRCYNPKNVRFYMYGARGIMVCDSWIKDFKAFIDHIGFPPSLSHSVDRINSNGNYQPGNVRWATIKEQQSNTRRNVFLTINGVTKCRAHWAREIGMSENGFKRRVNSGLTGDALLKI